MADIVKQYWHIDKGKMEGKPFITHIDRSTSFFKDKIKSLAAFNIIKENRCRKIKGRICSYDSKQKGL